MRRLSAKLDRWEIDGDWESRRGVLSGVFEVLVMAEEEEVEGLSMGEGRLRVWFGAWSPAAEATFEEEVAEGGCAIGLDWRYGEGARPSHEKLQHSGGSRWVVLGESPGVLSVCSGY